MFSFALRLLAVLSLVVAASLGLSYSAAAAPQGPWEFPAVNLSVPGEGADSPQVAIAPDGTATAVWVRSNGKNDLVQSATRPPGGTFGAPVNLSGPSKDAGEPKVFFAPDGTATVVWYLYDGKNYVIQAATRPPGGLFGAPVNLSGPGKDAGGQQAFVAPDGTATVVWSFYDGKDLVVQAVTRPPGGSFGTPVNLSEPGQDNNVPQVVVAPDGTVTAIWARDAGNGYVIQSVTRPPGGSFGAPVNLSGPVKIAEARKSLLPRMARQRLSGPSLTGRTSWFRP